MRRKTLWVLNECILCGENLRKCQRVCKCPACNYTMVRWPEQNKDYEFKNKIDDTLDELTIEKTKRDIDMKKSEVWLRCVESMIGNTGSSVCFETSRIIGRADNFCNAFEERFGFEAEDKKS